MWSLTIWFLFEFSNRFEKMINHISRVDFIWVLFVLFFETISRWINLILIFNFHCPFVCSATKFNWNVTSVQKEHRKFQQPILEVYTIAFSNMTWDDEVGFISLLFYSNNCVAPQSWCCRQRATSSSKQFRKCSKRSKRNSEKIACSTRQSCRGRTIFCAW